MWKHTWQRRHIESSIHNESWKGTHANSTSGTQADTASAPDFYFRSCSTCPWSCIIVEKNLTSSYQGFCYQVPLDGLFCAMKAYLFLLKVSQWDCIESDESTALPIATAYFWSPCIDASSPLLRIWIFACHTETWPKAKQGFRVFASLRAGRTPVQVRNIGTSALPRSCHE